MASEKCDLYADLDHMDELLSPRRAEVVIKRLEAKGYTVFPYVDRYDFKKPNRASIGYYQTTQVCYEGDPGKIALAIDGLLYSDLYYFSISIGETKYEAKRETKVFKLKLSTRLGMALKVVEEIPECLE